jgi:N-acetylneuraminic acid mutarotase
MKRFLPVFLFILCLGDRLIAQVAINTTGAVPNGSAMLDIESSSKGLLIPRMKTSERLAIVSPAKGLMVFDSDLVAFVFYDGASWQVVGKNLPSGTIVLSQSASDANLISAGFSYLGQANFDQYQAVAATIPANSWYPASVGLTGRTQATSIQAGNRIAIWGGQKDNIALNDGAFYDPVADTWEPIPATGAPSPRVSFAMVWTGTELVIWGGYVYTGIYTYFNDGARYNPTTKTWSPLGVTGVPAGRGECAYGYNAATSEMVIWGGFNGPRLTDGARYNFTTQSWSAINNAGNPGQLLNTAFTMGTGRLYIWGGYSFASSAQTNNGYYYNLASNTWTALPVAGAPTAREQAHAVWTGTELLIWGGMSGASTYLSNGGRYNPGSNTWPSLIPSGPVAELGSNAVFANNKMFISGINGSALYDNTLNNWPAMNNFSMPVIGNQGIVNTANGIFLIWGGIRYGSVTDYAPYYEVGGRYFVNATPVTNNIRSVQSYYLYKKN